MDASRDGGGLRRLRVSYDGRVQGVGFRYSTLEIAQRHAVSGHVRNRADGTVELEVQGCAEELERFLAAVAARFERNIRDEQRIEVAVRPDDEQFEIRV